MNRTQRGRFGPDRRLDGGGRVSWVDRATSPPADRSTGRSADGPAIRLAGRADVPALRDFFAGLSARSRYLRFFAPVTPGADMLRVLSGDAGSTDAVIAVRGTVVIGHAMAVDQAAPGGPSGSGQPSRTTDVGVVVADAWQGRGLGSALMRALIARAWARGVTSVTMDVLPGNRRVLAMIASHWPSARIDHFPDCTTICVSLPPDAPQYLHADDLAAGRPGLAAADARRVEVEVAR